MNGTENNDPGSSKLIGTIQDTLKILDSRCHCLERIKYKHKRITLLLIRGFSCSVFRLIRLVARQFGYRKTVRNVRNEILSKLIDIHEQHLRQVILSNLHNGQKGCMNLIFGMVVYLEHIWVTFEIKVIGSGS